MTKLYPILLLLTPLLGWSQSITSVAPNQGGQYEQITLAVQCSGTNFTQGSATLANLALIPTDPLGQVLSSNQVNFTDSITAEFVIAIPIDAVTGQYDLSLDLLNGTVLSAPNAIEVTPNANLVSISPSSAALSQTLTVGISGINTNFDASTTVTLFQQGSGTAVLTGSNATALSSTYISSDFTIDVLDNPGYYQLKVESTMDGILSLNYFTIEESGIEIAPDYGTQNDTLTIGITGYNSNFGVGSDQVFLEFSQGSSTTPVIPASNIDINSSTSVSAQFALTDSTTISQMTSWQMKVFNSSDGTMSQEFFMNPSTSGNLIISGTLINGSGNKTADSALVNEMIYLIDELDNVFKVVRTNANGYFEFSDLEAGTYKIKSANSLNMLALNVNAATITENLSFEIDQLELSVLSALKVALKSHAKINIFPTPFNNQSHFSFILYKECDVLIEAYNILGNKIAKITDKKYGVGNHQVSYDFNGHTETGVIFFQITIDGVSYTQRSIRSN